MNNNRLNRFMDYYQYYCDEYSNSLMNTKDYSKAKHYLSRLTFIRAYITKH